MSIFKMTLARTGVLRDTHRKYFLHHPPYLVRLLLVGLSVIFCGSAGAAPLQAQPGASAIVSPANIDDQAFVEFNLWTEKYLAAAPEEKNPLEAQGVELAKVRRETMLQFIVFDPQRAFEYAVPMRTRQQLPLVIINELEKRLSGRGEFEVTATIYQDEKTGQPRTRIQRSVALDGTTYHASVYGSRLGITSKNRLAWHGIALTDYIALYHSPLRRLEVGDTIAPDAAIGNKKRCPVCGVDASAGIAVDIGGVVYFFDSEEHLKKIETQIEKEEAVIDPEVSGLGLLETTQG